MALDGMPEAPAPAPAASPAVPAIPQWIAPDVERMVLFKLGTRAFGLPIDDVQEIQQIVALTEFPDTAPALVGMVNLRGRVVPVIDLRLLLGMEALPYTLETPMIVCRRDERLVALIVDEVDDVIELPEECMQQASRLYELADKLMAVCRMENELVFLIDFATLVPDTDLAALARLGEKV